ncbi:hypothetical protein C8J57DRAFT_1273646 [Mycena rebaudengoi]|nr:hypothetical protein C8J57DRAFT_1273646 [Mycena rebaudengoi]
MRANELTAPTHQTHARTSPQGSWRVWMRVPRMPRAGGGSGWMGTSCLPSAGCASRCASTLRSSAYTPSLAFARRCVPVPKWPARARRVRTRHMRLQRSWKSSGGGPMSSRRRSARRCARCARVAGLRGVLPLEPSGKRPSARRAGSVFRR